MIIQPASCPNSVNWTGTYKHCFGNETVKSTNCLKGNILLKGTTVQQIIKSHGDITASNAFTKELDATGAVSVMMSTCTKIRASSAVVSYSCVEEVFAHDIELVSSSISGAIKTFMGPILATGCEVLGDVSDSNAGPLNEGLIVLNECKKVRSVTSHYYLEIVCSAIDEVVASKAKISNSKIRKLSCYPAKVEIKGSTIERIHAIGTIFSPDNVLVLHNSIVDTVEFISHKGKVILLGTSTVREVIGGVIERK